jgi:hypothetical protein
MSIENKITNLKEIANSQYKVLQDIDQSVSYLDSKREESDAMTAENGYSGMPNLLIKLHGIEMLLMRNGNLLESLSKRLKESLGQ